MADQITVHKLDHSGREKLSYTGMLLQQDESSVMLEAFFRRETMPLGYVTLKPGDRFVEHFYADRWYNVFAIYDVDTGEFKGWYCNVTRPAEITDGHVRAEDLELDVFVSPDWMITLLDEAEFNALGLSTEESASARAGLEELLRLAKERTGPFAPVIAGVNTSTNDQQTDGNSGE